MSYVVRSKGLVSVHRPLGWTDEELWGERYKAPETYQDPLERWVASWWSPELSMGLLVVGGVLMLWPYGKK